jgi:SAM-dependent methyltransferase
MVRDPHRTPALLRAVAQAVRPGDIVIDIGTGLGILAIAAAKAGAHCVWALDVDRGALQAARRNAEAAGVGRQITFLHLLSFDARLPARADLLLCETVGSFAFDENILATLADAKRRLAKEGARIVPERLELWGALLRRLPKIEEPSGTGRARPAALLSRPSRIADIDFAGRIPRALQANARFVPERDGCAVGLALWPRVIWWGKEVSDASPLSPATHWKQGILPLTPREAKAGTSLGVELKIGPHPNDPRRMTERLWRWK